MGNRVAFITGSGQGIGEAIAYRLANDGFAVGVADIDLAKAEKVASSIVAQGKNALAIKLDVSKREDFADAVKTVADTFGGFDVLVNNAGIGGTTPLEEITLDAFDSVFHVNVAGVIWGIQAALAQFKRFNHGGKIINATSQAGVVGNPELAIYSGTKFAIRGITQVAARDLAPQNITVNAYAPGFVDTPLMRNTAYNLAKIAGKDKEWGLEQYINQTALKRLSTPDDIASIVSFLSGHDSDYITGQTIIVDGGVQFH